MKKLAAVLLALCLVAVVADARQFSDVKCTNKKCDFKTGLGEGPNETSSFLSGYCKKYGKFVERGWVTKKEKSPATVKAWDPALGKERELFHCPNCDSFVFDIKDRSEFKFCPKCNSSKIEISEPHTIED